ncbi:MAG: hypothetical protein CEO22_682 [Candidatus Berkelbacteria bacterium Gr01-1014_85]|uniref:TraC-like domain-containing protein n=1 Tax=Candidatus Berkelbacteria bacterium Gr01-1014_85 TaxID=2017150 RepID=A0A554J919_9BACT|nr:MAG: hypothetical protein CEO22_682 [Candidatus Berkelbacteria bacterium Gr01-1014_85]
MPVKQSVARKKSLPPTQAVVPFVGLNERAWIGRDGSLTGALEITPVNFALKSQEEQTAIFLRYQNLLNALQFPVQIVVQSRPINLDEYLISLAKSAETLPNQAVRLQIADQISFLGRLIVAAKMMAKRFYIIVRVAPSRPVLNLLRGRSTTENISGDDLEARLSTLADGLTGLGLTATRLDDQALEALLYQSYNPTP